MIKFIIISLLVQSNLLLAQNISFNNFSLNSESFAIVEFEGNPPKRGYKKELQLKNTGDDTLIITAADGGCDCTKIRIKKRKLKPQETTKVIIKWNPSKDTEFSSSVSIQSNAINHKEIWLQLLGNVEK